MWWLSLGIGVVGAVFFVLGQFVHAWSARTTGSRSWCRCRPDGATLPVALAGVVIEQVVSVPLVELNTPSTELVSPLAVSVHFAQPVPMVQ